VVYRGAIHSPILERATQMIDEDQYSMELHGVTDELIKILNSDWDNIRLPLRDKAAKFLMREIFIKSHMPGKDVQRYFPSINDYHRFYAELIQLADPSVQFSNIDIGKYCTVLFLVHDRCMGQHLYNDINAAVQIITEGRLCLDEKPPSFEDYLKEGDNPAQNTKADFIYRLKKYLSFIKYYLEVKGLLGKSNDTEKTDLAITNPAETKQKDTPTTIININKLGVLGDIQKVETLQTGDNASAHKHVGSEEKKKGILSRIPYWVYLLVSFLSALFACIHYWPEIQQKLQSLFSH
jgi:hypothetical protein